MTRSWWYADDGGLVFEDRPAPRSDPEWHSVPVLLRELEEDIERQWNADLSAIEALREQPVAGKPHVKGLVSEKSYPAGTAGPVTVRNAETGYLYEDPAYSAADLRAIERQGKLAPRMLDLAETRLATNNRREAADLARWLERTLPYARG